MWVHTRTHTDIHTSTTKTEAPWRAQPGNIYTNACKTVRLRELKLGLCDNVEGWNEVEGGREAQKGGDIGIPMAG